MKNRGKKVISLAQIWLLVSMTFAVAFLLGQEIKIVSATITAVSSSNNGQYVQGDDKKIYEYNSATDTYVITSQSLLPGVNDPTPKVSSNGIRLNGAAAQVIVPSVTQGSVNPAIPHETDFLKISTSLLGTGTSALNGIQQANNIIQKGEDPTVIFGSNSPSTTPKNPAAPATPPKSCLFYFSPLCDTSTTGYGYLYDGINHALIMITIAQLAGSALGIGTKNTQSLTLALTAGQATYDILKAIKGLNAGQGKSNLFSSVSTGQMFVYASLVAVAVFVLTYKKEKQQLVDFQCLPFEPALGGANCEKCNADPLRPCSEYRCKSLGQACQLLNAGTGNEKCAWVNPKDVTSPTISEWNEALKPRNLVYNPDPAVRPGARGVKILSNAADGCLPAFTPLQFGVTTNEPAQCKIDFNRTSNFDKMQYYFGGSNYYDYNHTQVMRLPSPNSADSDISPMLQNDGTFSMFVRCQDANGNSNVDEYSINFCVSAAPDTTPPIIEGTSITDGSAVQAGADKVPIEVYVNEPSNCKWSKQDKEFNDMENNMTCINNNVNANLQYTCTTNLTGVADMQNNSFFFRCKDKPSAPDAERNTMRQSYPLTLMGTEGLAIISVSPNGTITGSTTTVPVSLAVETGFGASDGKATCRFSPSGADGSYVDMFTTNAPIHSQTLNLVGGTYTYYIRCVDAGGNLVDTNTTFSVAVDNTAPIVTRVYKDNSDVLKIVTNENAQCVYSLNNCNYDFKDGIKFNYQTTDSQTEHTTSWKTNTPFYIKCQDGYGNQPNPGTCSIIATGLNLDVQAKTSG